MREAWIRAVYNPVRAMGGSMKEVCKNCMCYNDGWCEAFVVQKLPTTKGCFGFIPKEKEG